MKIFKILVLLLLSSVSCWANNCTTSGGSGSGNWNTAGVWTACGATFPGSGDTATITTGVTVTVPNGVTATWGTSGVTGTVGLTVNQGGILVIASGGTMNARDTLTLQRGSTLTIAGGATYNFNCPDGSICRINLSATGSGAVNFNVGTSGTFGNLVNVPQGTTGIAQIDFSNNGSNTIINMNGFLLSGIGNATNRAILANLSPSSPNATTFENGVVLNSGEVNLTNNNAASNFTISHVDFRNCVDVSGSSQGNTCLTALANTAATTGVRTFNYLTAYNTTGKTIHLPINAGQCGASVLAGDGSDIPCLTSLNTGLYSNGVTTPFTARTVFIATDVDLSPFVAIVANTTSSVQNSIFLGHNENQHEINSASGGGASSGNTVSYNLCDGDGFLQSDTGDFVVDSGGPEALSNNLIINSCGTMLNASGTATAFTFLHNTVYQSYSGVVGETNGAAIQIAVFRNNLIINPSTLGGFAGQGGLQQPAPFVTQTMAAGSLDYNAFFGTMNGTNLTNATLGGTVSYMEPESHAAWFTSATYGTTSGYGTHDLHVDPTFVDSTRSVCKWYNFNGGYANCPSTVSRATTAGSGTTTIVCSTCNFTTEGITTNDFVVGYNGSTYLGLAAVTVVNSSTSITISPAMTGMTSGVTFSFVTDVIGIAKNIVTVNGFDYQGNAITPVAWATVPNALAYVRAGFAPTNAAVHNTGSDGTDIGALGFQSPPAPPTSVQAITAGVTLTSGASMR